MATTELSPSAPFATDLASTRQIPAERYYIGLIVAFLASLRLTVGLFAFSIILVFLGTLAQKDQDVWQVVNDTYFRVWFARVDFLVFERFAQIFFKSVEWNLPGGFYIPGGKLLGSLLLLNLLAAHSIRFKIAATGNRLRYGLAIIAAGLVITYLAIQSGMNQAVESELSPAFCDLLWQFFRGSLAVVTLAGAYVLIFKSPERRLIEWRVLFAVVALLAILTIWLLANPEARLDNSGIRILWQLVKGASAGIVLLIGCIMVFRRRAGIVLLHAGIGLMMLSELLTGISATESRMAIPEGGTVNYSDDIRTTELAVTDRSGKEHDRVTVVPASMLVDNVGSDALVEHDDLPFKIRVLRWLQNSSLRDVKPGESNPATAGAGEHKIAETAPPSTGVGESSQKVDFPAAYVELFSKESGKSLGTYLTSQWLDDQPVEVDGKKYDVSLRFKRLYHPYSITLKDFRFDRYTGTNTAKNFSSLVEFKDPRHNIDREVPIWMNNPLRYQGTTFYQQSYDEATERSTVLQVVTNPSWMTPYVACMLVATGMIAHFGTMLVGFLRRRSDETAGEGSVGTAHQRDLPSRDTSRRTKSVGSAHPTVWSFRKLFPLLIVTLFGGYILSKARLPKSPPNEMQVYEFGQLPLAYQGRVKPYDTLARNVLQMLSGRQEVTIQHKGETSTKVPAIRWLLDAISGAKGSEDYPIFRIENLDVLDGLGLEHRPLFWRYSLSEINNKPAAAADDPEITTELQRQIKLADETPEKERSLFQNKMLQLRDKQQMYMALVLSFRSPPLSAKQEDIAASWQKSLGMIDMLSRAGAPHAVPPMTASTNWQLLMEAELEALRNRVMNQPVNPATLTLSSMLGSYAQGDVAAFNKQLSEYRRLLADYQRALATGAKELKTAGAAKAEILSQPKIEFEVFFNQFSPFYYAQVLYVIAFVLGVMSWMGTSWTEPFRRGSIWLLWLAFAVHTFAIVARIYISGRPPITNLYSTAIFIGWAGVFMALVFESIHRLGLGNIVASVIGFLTLLVAYNLSFDGDTFIVLQAVLDTQFWLATHVIAMNLGYAATFIAGLWGAFYILLGHVFPMLTDDSRRQVLRIAYGTLCFAIFFSFIGTVLGGLWADDSWGRFWGWDPKENGALIIVLWNALVLHARWGGLAKGRILATLMVAGNIVVAWSWFGVNELGVGLHSYGASESSTAMWLLTFGASQLAIIGLGLMPASWFGSQEVSREMK
jgi:ABC-type transport system involved in cytochrome c biogenesis permease subunit